MDTSPSHADAAKRPRGDMSLRAEPPHHAETAATKLTGILTPAVQGVIITTSAVVESIGAPAASLPDPARAGGPAPQPMEAAPETEPPWVSEVALPAARPPVASPAVARPPVARPPVASLLVRIPATPTNLPLAGRPAASEPVRIQPARTSARQQWERVTPAQLRGAALATIGIALLVGTASSLWRSGKTDALPDSPPATAAASPSPTRVASAPVAKAPVVAAPAPQAPGDRSTLLASQVPADHPTGTVGLANRPRQPAVHAPRADAPAVTPVHTASEGQLRITSTPPGARVTVNGVGWGQTPLTVGHLPLGTKTVRLTYDGYASQERVVELSGNDGSAALSVALQRRSDQGSR